MATATSGVGTATTRRKSRWKEHSSSGEVFFLCVDAALDSAQERPRRGERTRLILEQIDNIGTRSIGLILAAGLATGAVMALQFGNGLRRFGGALYVPEIVSLAVFRELAPVLVSLLLAGRVGSSITSELASMHVTEQIDAIRALGDSPHATLVMPRLVACLIAFPVLTLLCDLTATLSAMAVCWGQISISPSLYLSKAHDILVFADLWTGLLKALVFGLFIGSVACWKGLRTSGGTRGVGFSTTWIVVRSSIFILIADFILSKLFLLTVLSFYG